MVGRILMKVDKKGAEAIIKLVGNHDEFNYSTPVLNHFQHYIFISDNSRIFVAVYLIQKVGRIMMRGVNGGAEEPIIIDNDIMPRICNNRFISVKFSKQ